MSQAGEGSIDQAPRDKVLPLYGVKAPVPNPEVLPNPTARRFTAEYKERILREVEECRHGEIGALLRREGLYTSTVAKWRKQRERAIRRGLLPQRPGPKPEEPNPLADELKRVKHENAVLQKRLKQAEAIIEVQKKISEILQIPLSPPEKDSND